MTNCISEDLTAGQSHLLFRETMGHNQPPQISSDEFKVYPPSMTSDKTIVSSTIARQSLTVLANFTFEERIKRGKYGWCNSGLIEKHFSVTTEQIGDWEWKLFCFDQSISSENAIRLIKEDGFALGQIGHILAFGEKYPEEQCKYPIVGLGSDAYVRLYRSVPELRSVDGKRRLDLGWFAYGWGRHYRFLGVR